MRVQTRVNSIDNALARRNLWNFPRKILDPSISMNTQPHRQSNEIPRKNPRSSARCRNRERQRLSRVFPSFSCLFIRACENLRNWKLVTTPRRARTREPWPLISAHSRAATRRSRPWMCTVIMHSRYQCLRDRSARSCLLIDRYRCNIG